MSKRHIPESHGAHPNVTPLIDVVMVLIVFFMLVAKIGVNTGADEKIKIPATILGIELKDMTSKLVLNVKPGVLERPDVYALVPNTKTGGMELTELKVEGQGDNTPLINTLRLFRYGRDLKKGGTGENTDNENFEVIIRGQHDMPYHYLEHVLMACAKANVKAVNFNTSKVIEQTPVAVNQ